MRRDSMLVRLAWTLIVLPAALTQESQFDNLGCVVDDEQRALETIPGVSPVQSSTMTVDYCSAHCNGYHYFGIQNGNECWCGNSIDFSAYPILSNGNDECNFDCPGDNSQTCGAWWRMNVFDTRARTDVAYVGFDGGSFQQGSEKVWAETSQFCPVVCLFNEIGRTTSSVTVLNPGSGIYLLFDFLANDVYIKFAPDGNYSHVYDITSTATLGQSLDTFKSIAHEYAPIVWLANGEEWFPSSVTYFQSKVNLVGNRYVTKDALDSPSDWSWDGALGQDPTTQTVPTYAFINVDLNNLNGPFFDVTYFAFYPYNRGKEKLDTVFGNHVGDWENVRITFGKATNGTYFPQTVRYESHGDGVTRDWANAEKEGNRLVVYSAWGSHGVYPTAGNWTYANIPVLGSLVDHTSQGKRWDTSKSVVIVFKDTLPILNYPVTDLFVSESATCYYPYTRVEQSHDLNGDLNQDAGGKDIYLCEARVWEAAPLTNFYLSQSPGCPPGYFIAPKQSSLNGDLNQGAGGKDIYLCLERDPNKPTITDLVLTSSGSPPGGFPYYPGVEGDLNRDFNQGSGGKFIYLYGRLATSASNELVWVCTGNRGEPYAEDCATWLNFPFLPDAFRWGNNEEGCTFGECRLETGPTGPALKDAVIHPGF